LPIVQAKDSAVIVFDASGSMWGQIKGKAKIEIAREVMGTLVKDWNEDIELGLMAYGHREKGNCNDIEMLQTISTVDSDKMLKIINKIIPKGKTPIGQSLRQAAETLRYTEDPATVILISDGEETCNADPCVISKELEAKGINFTTHVIGFDIKRNKKALKQLKCIAKNTGGEFYQAEDAPSLKKALVKVRKAVVDPRPTLCKTYAENAVKQERIDIEEECGFEGKFWTTEYATHFDWCMGQEIGSELPDEENKERMEQLKKCKITKQFSKGGKGEFIFNWPDRRYWNVFRGDVEIEHQRGSSEGKLALEAGIYTVKPYKGKNIFTPFQVTIKKGKTTTINKGGLLKFNWPDRHYWNVFRGDVEVEHQRGSSEGKLALEAGIYTVKPYKGKNIFTPFQVTIKKGETTTINKGGLLKLNWPDGRYWNVFRGDVEVEHQRGSSEGKLALEAGIYTVKPYNEKNIFEPFQVVIKKGETLIVNK
jgi:hypothetical protein